MSAEASAGIDVRRRELKVVERKIENILEAIADGLKASGIQQKLSELEARRDELRAASAEASTAPPALHPNLAQTYAERVAELRRGIDAGKGQDVLEAARALIDKVIVTPGDDPDDPPGIELVGQLMAMLKAAGAFPNGDDAKCRDLVSGLSTGSAKGTMRGQSPSDLSTVSPRRQEPHDVARLRHDRLGDRGGAVRPDPQRGIQRRRVLQQPLHLRRDRRQMRDQRIRQR